VSIGRTPRVIGIAALAGTYAFLAVRAFLEFDRDWDFLAYHLPGALDAFGLTTYTPEPRLVAVNQGFPPLPRAVQGLLVLATGRISAASGFGVLAFAGLCAGLAALHGRDFAWGWFLTALLAVPLFTLHLMSGYVDLPAGAALALGFAALGELGPRARRPRRAAWLCAAALVAAVLTKFQAWPIAAILGALALWRLLGLARAGRLSRGFAAGAALALILGAGAWPIRNLIRFHNPVYPVEFPLAPGLFRNASIDADSSWLNTPHWLHPTPRPARFAISALELSRLHSNESFHWSLDQGGALAPTRSRHNRLGGWFFVSVIALLAGAAHALARRRVPLLEASAFALAVAAVSALPQSHELRYWLFVPLVLAAWTARGLAGRARAARALLGPVFAASALWVLLAVDAFTLDPRPPAAFAPAAAREFWRTHSPDPEGPPIRICDQNPRAIFWSGPTFREYRVEACFSS
jgi:hypothetical protein